MLTAEEKNQLLYKLDPKAVEPVKKAKDYTIYEALNFFLNQKNEKKSHKKRHHHAKKEDSEDEELWYLEFII